MAAAGQAHPSHDAVLKQPRRRRPGSRAVGIDRAPPHAEDRQGKAVGDRSGTRREHFAAADLGCDASRASAVSARAMQRPHPTNSSQLTPAVSLRRCPLMVRRGSTVRVRQRALEKRRKPGLLLSGPLARSTACGGYGALYGALSSKSVSVRREKRPRCDQGRTQPRPLRSRAAELGLLDVLGRVRGLAKPRMPGFLFGCAVACLTGTGPVGTAGTPRP